MSIYWHFPNFTDTTLKRVHFTVICTQQKTDEWLKIYFCFLNEMELFLKILLLSN